ncbi:hypothetical protein ABZ319_32085 [Nocardia sp. NPDC005978]|uniref:hypothetical protein n=1 Tax=Nocardia sp. NPDC005978 TaxID=3156725 RepID=UPI0033B361D0
MTITDHLIAPGATRGETGLALGTAFLGAAAAFALAVHAGYTALTIAVITFVAFDMFGGAVVNATTSAKHHFHRDSRTTRHHLGFVAIHVQPFLLAWATPGFTWATAAAIYATALCCALLITSSPPNLRRPSAFAVTTFALVCVTALLTVPQALAWFAPVLLIKLLLAHLLPVDPHPLPGSPAPAAA